MPAPMMPAPNTPTDLIGFGLTFASRDAGVFLVAIGEEEDVDQRAIDRRAEQLGNALGFGLAGRFDIDAGRAEHHFERGERRRILPLGLLLDVGRGRGAQEPQLGFV